MSAKPSIVLIDDSPEVRALVRTQIRLSGVFDVVGEGANGLDAAALANRFQPTVMLLDVSMPVVDGLAALPQVLGSSPGTRVVMYSGFDEAGLAGRACELGARGFVQKSAPFEELLATLRDVSGIGPDDREAQAQLRSDGPVLDPVLEQHLERFREVFEDAAIGMATMTLAGRIVRANHSLAGLLGFSVDDLIGKALEEIAGKDAVSEAFERLAAGEQIVQVEHHMADRDERTFRSTLSPVIDVAGRPLYLFLQVQDVTGQVAAENQLRGSEARFRLLVEAVQDYAIFMLDPAGHITSWNAGAQRSKGYRAEEIIGQHFRIFYPPEKQEARHPEYELEEALRHGKYEEEGWRVRKDNSQFWANVTITAVHDAHGELVGFAKVTRDTTERRNMLRDQEDANRQLAELAEQQAQFFAVTAHELRGPVAVLSGASTTLADKFEFLEVEERTDLTQAVKHSSDQLRRLLDDLLTAARLQARRLELSITDVNLDHVLRTVVAGLSGASDDVHIVISGEPGLRLAADPVRLRQMLENLLSNALRHGSSPVGVRVDGVGQMVEIEITDAGAGVPADMRTQLFERFATGSDSGTGLGLYLVRELARAHHGEASYRAGDQAFVLALPRAPE